MKKEPVQPKSRIPEFKSIEEEAEFWDTHDTTDYEDEFKPVKMRFAKKLSDGVTLRLDAETLRKLYLLGDKGDTVPVALAITWINERLSAEEERQMATAKVA